MLWNAQLPHLNATQMTFNCTSCLLGGDFSFSIKLITFFFFLNHSNATKKLYFLWDLPILYGRNPWYQFQDDNNFIIRPRNLWPYVYLVDKTPDTPNMPRRHHLTKMVVFPDSYSNSSFSSSLCA